MKAAVAYADKEKLRQAQARQAMSAAAPTTTQMTRGKKERGASVSFAGDRSATAASAVGSDTAAPTIPGDVGALMPKPSLSEHDRTIIKRMQNLAQSVSATVDMTRSRGGGGVYDTCFDVTPASFLAFVLCLLLLLLLVVVMMVLLLLTLAFPLASSCCLCLLGLLVGCCVRHLSLIHI